MSEPGSTSEIEIIEIEIQLLIKWLGPLREHDETSVTSLFPFHMLSSHCCFDTIVCVETVNPPAAD